HDSHACDFDGMRDPAQLRLAHHVLTQGPRGLAREDGVRLAGEGRAQQSVMQSRDGLRTDGEQRAPRNRAARVHPTPVFEVLQRPDGQLLQADDVRAVARHEPDHLQQERPAPGRRRLAVEEVPGPHEHGHGVAYEAVRVLLADPPAFTPPYDHELAEALARAGAEVELVTSRFRFGAVPDPAGYRRRELFYPLSSRVF